MPTWNPADRMKAREAKGQSATPELNEGPARISRECRVPGAVVGWEHYESSRKGTPGLLVRFVALDGPEAGKIAERTFWLTDAAVDQFLDFVLALGHTEPIDPYNDDHLGSAFSRGAVMMDVRGESWQDRNGNERTSYRPAWFGAYRGEGSKAWNEIMEQAEEGWNRYIAWRAKNPRTAPGESSGYSSSGGDEDIPF